MRDTAPSTNDILVCDIGTESIKVGEAGSLVPQRITRTVVGYPDRSVIQKRDESMSLNVFGDEAAVMSNEAVSWPIKKGVIVDWEAMRDLLREAFSDRKARHTRLLLTQSPLMTTDDTQKLLQFFWKDLGFTSVHVHNQAALVLYTQGLHTSLVVEIGDGMTHIVPVYEGYAMLHSVKSVHMGGRTMSAYLVKLLQQSGYQGFDPAQYLELAKHIKESLCYTVCDLEQERRVANETTILVEDVCLEDGTVLKVGRERFEAAEVLFDPSLLELEGKGLADLVFDTIQETDIDCRLDYFQNIILSGGATLLPGLRERLEKEIRQRFLKQVLKGDQTRLDNFQLNVVSPPGRQTLVFQGGSMLADIVRHQPEFWVSVSDNTKSNATAERHASNRQ